MENNDKINILDTDVAIIGIGLRLPKSSNIEEFWSNLINKKDCISKYTSDRWNKDYLKYFEQGDSAGFIDFKEWKNFDNEFFGISNHEAIILDPQTRLLLKCVYELFEDSRLSDSHRGTNTSVFIGSHLNEYEEINSKDLSLGTYHTFLANQISYVFDLRGQSAVINTACSSSFDCINFGYKSIINGESEMSICGGVNAIFNNNFTTKLGGAGAITTTGRCHTFQSNADGYCRGEGVGLVLLKKYSKAIIDGDNVYAVIKTCNTNNDGSLGKATRTMPSSIGQSANIKQALKNINMDPSEIYYVEPHGTGTPVGDPIEMKAIGMAFSESHQEIPLYMGSLKPNIGHLESASGATALIKVALMLKNRKLCPMFKFEDPNPNIKFDEWKIKIVTEEQNFPFNKKINIGINNFGIGSTNTFIIVSECIDIFQNYSNNSKNIVNDNNDEILIPFSANSVNSLNNYKNKILESIDNYLKEKNISFNQFLMEQCNKNHFNHRSVIKAKNWNDLKSMNEISSTQINSYSTYNTKQNIPIVLIFCGQGPQYKEMFNLYPINEIFKTHIDICDNNLKKYYGYSILEKINKLKQNNDESLSINEPIIAQASIFLIQYGLLQLYKHWGIKFDAVIGHSFGEVTAAFASGIITLDIACKIIYYRAIFQNKTIGMGKMLSIGIGEEEYKNRYLNKEWFDKVEISSYNSKDSIVITSEESLLNEIKNDLKSNNIFSTLLTSPCPFHSSKQQIIKDDILSINLPNSLQPNIPFYSTVTSKKWNSSNNFDSQYLYDNIRNPVLFQQTLDSLYKDQDIIINKNIIFIEISPNPTLSYYIKNSNSQLNITLINPINKKKDQLESFNNSIGLIYCSGGNVDFKSQIKNKNQIKNSYNFLPRYQFDEKEFWREDEEYAFIRKNGTSVDMLGLKIENVGNTIYKTTIDLSKNAFKYLLDHKIGNEIYYPGFAYINSIIKLYEKSGFILSYFNFTSPIIFSETSKCEIQIIITKLLKNEDKIQFFKKENGKDDSYKEVANGKISMHTFNQNVKINDLKEIKDHCYITINKNQLYDYIKNNIGFNYGPKFQRVEEISIGKIYSLYKISIKEKDSDYFDNGFFNVSILDSTAHNGFFQFEGNYYHCVFDRIENLIYYSDNIPKSREGIDYINVVSKYIKKEEKSLFYEMTCFLDNGLILFKSKVVLTNLVKLDEKIKIINPNSKISSIDWQLKESQLLSPNSFTIKFGERKINLYYYYHVDILKKWVSIYWYKKIKNNKEITISPEIIKNWSIEELSNHYFIKNSPTTIHEKRIFNKIFKTMKEHYEYLNEEIDISTIKIKDEVRADDILEALITNIEYQLSQCIQYENKQKFENFNALEKSEMFYKIAPSFLNESICHSIKEMLIPLLFTKTTFKIIEFGGGDCGLTLSVIKSIDELLNQFTNNLIEIEYTFSDISPSFFTKAKELLQEFKNVKVVYKIINIDKDLVKQDLNPTTYDLVLMQFVLHCAKDLNYTIDQIHSIMNPNSHIIFMELSRGDFYTDCIFSNFHQWNHYNDTIRGEHCCLDVKEWIDLLTTKGFNKEISSSKSISDSTPLMFYIHAQKEKLFSNLKSKDYIDGKMKIYDNVIIYSSDSNDLNNLLDNHYSKVSKNPIKKIKSSNEIYELSTLPIYKNSKNNLIVFGKGLDNLKEDNFEYYCMELTSLLQFLLNNNYNNYKLILFTLNSQHNSINYINSSLIGVLKYFFIHPEVKCYSFDLDDISLMFYNSLENIEKLLNDSVTERYFMIRNNKLYIEKIHQEKNQRFKTNTFENENLIARLNKTLGCDFITLPKILKNKEVLVKVMATGINFKDMLYHLGQVTNSTMGIEYSGIVIEIGSDVLDLKIGDEVYGACQHGLSSHVITTSNNCIIKPSHISFEQAASIPVIFATSYYSLYGANQVKDGDVLLIHSGTGGIGLSALNLLKWKNFKGLIFVTVGSEEKKKYLIDKYGSFINGIYSTRDIEFSFKIPEYLQMIGSSKTGIDIILNTLSGEFMNIHYSLLNEGGKIIDLSVTHILKNELHDYKSMGFHRSYSQVDMSINNDLISSNLKEISDYFHNDQINLVPIKLYPIERINELFDEMGSRKHIGKLVINYGDGSFFKNSIKNNIYKYNIVKENYKINTEKYLGKTILVTGQKGLALNTIKWLLSFSDNKLKDIIILSRSDMDYEMKATINKYRSNGGSIRIHFKKVQISKYDLIRKSVNEIYLENKYIEPVESIFHFAFQLSDALTNKTKLQNLIEAHSGKSHGAINLHNLSIEMKWNIKTFLLNSSIMTFSGSEFQLSYFSSNFLIESLNRHRKSLGLASNVISWGALDSSFITRNSEQISNINFDYLLTIDEILGGIDLSIQNQEKYPILIICTFDPKLIKNQLFQNHLDHAFNIVKTYNSTKNDLSIKDNIIFKISSLLQIDSNKLNLDVKLSDYGADSLLMTQLRNWLEKEYLQITLEKLQNSTINKIVEIVELN